MSTPPRWSWPGAGVFNSDQVESVSPERLERYFTERDGKYHVTSALRQMIVFAQHNAIKDAPFTNLDLISCRNLLIYFQPLRKREPSRCSTSA